jgi:hypothetical protein
MYNNNPIDLLNEELPKKPIISSPTTKFGVFISSVRNMIASSAIAVAILILHKKQSTNIYQLYVAKLISLSIIAFSFFTGVYSIKDLNLYMNMINKKYNDKLPDYYRQTFNNWQIWIYTVYLYMFILALCTIALFLIEFKLQ